MGRAFTLKCGSSSERIGELFLKKGLITEEQLKEALEYQKRYGGRLGWILVSLGFVRGIDFFRALAEYYRLPFETDLGKILRTVNEQLVKQFEPHLLVEYEVVPARFENGVLLLYTSNPCSKKLEEFIEKFFSNFPIREVRQVVITDRDLRLLVARLFEKEILEGAVFGLFRDSPEHSARFVFTAGQLIFFYLTTVALLTSLFFYPITTLVVLNLFVQFFYLLSNLFKFAVSLAGTFTELEFKVEEEWLRELRDKDLPLYTVLVPAYREPQVVPYLVKALKRLDYPQNKLEVLFLLEEDDEETIEAVKRERPPANWHLLIVPPYGPKTKPKACNYGLFFAKGKYLVIYDAEDLPERDQLKKAVVAFDHHPESFVCFQAALNFFNRKENFLTRMFTLEYSYWFDYLLPGLHRLKMVIPLGGTSNHFITDKLRELGGWDPFNVTEDADLGVRAFEKGYKVGVVDSTTYEEANSKLGNWIRQRSRWIKGYMQTWLVHTRHPFRLLRRLGLRGFLSFHLLIGGTPFMFLTNPVLWGVFTYWLFTGTYAFEPFFPPFLLYTALFNLFMGNFLGIYLSMLAVFKRRFYDLLPYALLNPLYWVLHSVAAYKALWELFTKPFYWEKTEHGISKVKPKL